MSDTPNSEELLRQAGSLIASRQEGATGPLAEQQRTAVQDATLSIVRDLREGKAAAEVERGLIRAGWQPAVAGGFIRLVSQMLARMYLVRTSIFALLTLVTGMLGSVLVPMAGADEFSWMGAGVVVFVSLVCLLGTVRNLQLWRRFRAAKSA